jgi:hypothetical protein
MRMNEVKVGSRDGYDTFYDPNNKVFRVRDSQGNEITHGDTQDKVDKDIIQLVKTALKLPVLAVMWYYHKWERGRITSVNLEANTAWFSFDDKTRRHAEKVHLGGRADLFELTPANEALAKEVADLLIQQSGLEKRIEALGEKFEKPISREYFEEANHEGVID